MHAWDSSVCILLQPGGYVVDDSKPMGRAVKKMMWAGIRCFDGKAFKSAHPAWV